MNDNPITNSTQRYFHYTKGYQLLYDLKQRPFIRHPQCGLVTYCQDPQSAKAILTEFNIH